jgi:RNA polymerase sigma-70 factor (ECF subfamily)
VPGRNPPGVLERIPSVETSAGRTLRPWQRRSGGEGRRSELGALLGRVARGDQNAFEQVYQDVAGPVYGLVLRVVRDPAQAEEVAQEVLVDVWRTAARYDEARGTALAWVMTLAHRRAVDRVRSAQAAADREERAARAERDHDEVAEYVEARLEREQVRRCLGTLTDLQRESVTLAYYSGYTYREVAELLQVPLGTVKTRMRDGLIRMRDCLGVGEQ